VSVKLRMCVSMITIHKNRETFHHEMASLFFYMDPAVPLLLRFVLSWGFEALGTG